MKVKEAIDGIVDGEIIEVQASDFGFLADIDVWCKNTGNTVLDNQMEGTKVRAVIAKGRSLSKDYLKKVFSTKQKMVLLW